MLDANRGRPPWEDVQKLVALLISAIGPTAALIDAIAHLLGTAPRLL